MGGFDIGKDNLADKIWALGFALPHMADDRARQMLENAVAAIRKGCGKHDFVQRADIKQISQWIKQNEEDANRRIREMKEKEQKALQQARKKEEENQKQDKLKKNI